MSSSIKSHSLPLCPPQAVVRELVASKLPRLNAHLQEYAIDVTLVTFNWFLTLFVDALPTEVHVGGGGGGGLIPGVEGVGLYLGWRGWAHTWGGGGGLIP